eukprot:CAMPEP_0174274392 /NCGR_PEP_ID=MMETSP0439-20130205/57854_1 /TAXON_ID=0 /ORGANISM="Stereomyxa ramosa, Strain Chinc5" /LENGTH=605 /DNA_ID=CAMNT_0015366131 /DNA_START=617 /DNA_END=2434 /DNA_ORIENTATION=-
MTEIGSNYFNHSNKIGAKIVGYAVNDVTDSIAVTVIYSRFLLVVLSPLGSLLYNTSCSDQPAGSQPIVNNKGEIIIGDYTNIYLVNWQRNTTQTWNQEEVYLVNPTGCKMALDEKNQNLWIFNSQIHASSAVKYHFGENGSVSWKVVSECGECSFITLGLDDKGTAYFCVYDFTTRCFASQASNPGSLVEIGSCRDESRIELGVGNKMVFIPCGSELLLVKPEKLKKSEKGINKRLILIIACSGAGVLLVSVMIILLAYCAGKWRGKKKYYTVEEKSLILWLKEQKDNVDYINDHKQRNDIVDKICELIRKENWFIPFEEIQIDPLLPKLGGGGNGNVFLVKWRHMDIALKTMISGFWGTVEDFHGFSVEVQRLSMIRHPNIVLFLGVTVGHNLGIGILTEYCPKGSLVSLFQQEDVTVLWNIRMKIAIGTALGMYHLHSSYPPIIHTDIKPANILLLEDFTPKICDFGVSFGTGGAYDEIGTPLWRAPEIKRGEPITPKIDVYSYGLTLWTILTGILEPDIDFEDLESRPEIPSWCPASYADVMCRCWADDPEDRPTFWKIISKLQKRCLVDTDSLPSSYLDDAVRKQKWKGKMKMASSSSDDA